MDRVERTSLRILAKSTKESLGKNQLSDSLEKAAATGDKSHYKRAEEEYEALPKEDKSALKSKAHGEAKVTKQKILEIEAVKLKQPKGVHIPLEDTGKSWGGGSGSNNSLTPKSVKEIPLSVKKPASDDPTLLEDTEKNDWDWKTLPGNNLGPKRKPQSKEGQEISDLRKDLLGSGNKIDW